MRAILVAVGCMAALAVPCRADDEYAGERDHWSFQPRNRVQPPQFDDADELAWIRTDVDAFVLWRLKEAGLRPAPEADRRTLIRRLTFDFTGLPPAPSDIERFIADPARSAYEDLVERLLASPHYGERWGQHWLDVVRYAESEGFEYDNLMAGAWRYRDYVVQALNRDKPYDQFVREQVAGDELAPDDRTMLVAAGFNRLGPVRRNAGNQEVSSSRNEVLTEMTNAFGTVFLGLTVGCARCHDHMFDPIRQRDYYQLQAFFAGTHEHNLSLVGKAEQADWQARTDELQEELKGLSKELNSATDATRPAILDQIRAAEEKLPPPLPAVCTVQNDKLRQAPIHILERGNWDQPGEPVGMRAPGVLLPDGAEEFPPQTPQARSRLAQWLTQPDNPLTARVMVNRIWQYHFGQGIVDTSNDFGANGGAPSHPELLDYMANRFVDEGWSIKAIHRLIVLSSAYRQASSSPDDAANRKSHPENRLLWRANRRRLDAEEIRDAMLSVSGRLNLKAGGPSVVVPVDPDLVKLLYKPSQWAVTPDVREHDRRSIYLLAKRNLRLPFMEAFDQPGAQTSCARRHTSTHAPQALELLNGQLSNQLADAFAERLLTEAGSDPARQIELAFRLAAARPPTQNERQLAWKFLQKQPLREFALAVFNSNAFLYVE